MLHSSMTHNVHDLPDIIETLKVRKLRLLNHFIEVRADCTIFWMIIDKSRHK